jgi:hypothetical protein
MWLSARWGGAFTPVLAAMLLRHMPWRLKFVTFGSLGFVWAVLFYRWFRDHPRDHPSVNAAELELLKAVEETAGGHGHVPWRKFVASKQVWLLCAQYFCLAFWLVLRHHVATQVSARRAASGGGEERGAGGDAAVPGGIGCLVGGMIARRMNAWTGNTTRTRRTLAYIGFTGACGLLLLSTRLEDPVLAISRIVVRLQAVFLRRQPGVIPRRERILLVFEQSLEFQLLFVCRLEAEGNSVYRHRVLNGAFANQSLDPGSPAAAKNCLGLTVNSAGQALLPI